MSTHHIREEKVCLNCGNPVEQRYCGNCGQENIEPRQTFGHLVAHFFEDLTHYEGKFWGTLRYLFFKPAFLTKEFISGKRSKYLPPVRLYIFASFVTFLLPGLIPDVPSSPEEKKDSPIKVIQKDSTGTTVMNYEDYKDSMALVRQEVKAIKDSLAKRGVVDTSAVVVDGSVGYNDEEGFYYPGAEKTMHALDSAKAARKNTDDPMGYLEYKFNKKLIEFRKYPADLQNELLVKSLISNFPKALFVYMPLFALILRLFHRKRNWIYFDHGIFTLHLFSFTLLAFLSLVMLISVAEWVEYFAHADLLGWLTKIAVGVIIIWVPYYLFRAHRKMYEEHLFVSMLKVWGIIWLNAALFLAVIVGFVLITFLTIH